MFDTDGSPNEVGAFDDESGVEPEADCTNVSQLKNLFNLDSKLAMSESRISGKFAYEWCNGLKEMLGSSWNSRDWSTPGLIKTVGDV